ncbi:hypothetical protein B5E67_14220 [Faecalibacterium sp. An122]|nr:hypothetical protein B5E67_14220 [Faecalibacterium sp. An122]
MENDLLPYLNRDSVLILDNMKSHHTKAAKDLLDQAEVHYIYLPPSSPDLNPIEKLWSKRTVLLKNSIRKNPAKQEQLCICGIFRRRKTQ